MQMISLLIVAVICWSNIICNEGCYANLAANWTRLSPALISWSLILAPLHQHFINSKALVEIILISQNSVLLLSQLKCENLGPSKFVKYILGRASSNHNFISTHCVVALENNKRQRLTFVNHISFYNCLSGSLSASGNHLPPPSWPALTNNHAKHTIFNFISLLHYNDNPTEVRWLLWSWRRLGSIW